MAAVACPLGHEAGLNVGDAVNERVRASLGQQRLEQLGGQIGAEQDRPDRQHRARPAANDGHEHGYRGKEHIRVGVAQVGDEAGHPVHATVGMQVDEAGQDRLVGVLEDAARAAPAPT